MPSVLLVDDEPDIIEVLEVVLKEDGMDVFKSSSGREALAVLKTQDVDIVISDIQMPDISGLQLLQEAKQISPDAAFIMITAFASTETAIDALQHGAYDYLTKPFKMEELKVVARGALAHRDHKSGIEAAGNESEALQGQMLFQALHRNQLVGKSPKMLEIYRTIGTVAAGESTVLITGESGTGKELIARALHEASGRRDGPFVSINCGAFPETLLESELFGYMKGAFTGASGNKKGLFEFAGGGSIFLDEIGEMTHAMQVKLLRVLQDRRLRPLGGSAEVAVDVRVIAATNRNLQAAIEQGRFRDDLYYRVAVITLHLPPLRERPEDIDLLAFHFLRHYAERAGKIIVGISNEALRCLETYRWPGNVRELENTIERAVALETTETIRAERLPDFVRGLALRADHEFIALPEGSFDLDNYLASVERNLICQALEKAGGNQTLAAQRLQLTKPSLRHKIQTLAIDPSRFRDTD
jgi:two-component system response regulator PilR (NtrC family)